MRKTCGKYLPKDLKKQEKKKKLSGHFLLPFFHDNEKNTEGVYLTFLSSVRFVSTYCWMLTSLSFGI